MPVRAMVTEGPVADGSQGGTLIEGVDTGALPPDRACNTSALVAHCMERGMDRVENAFLHLEHRRDIATRQAGRADSFPAAIHTRCLVLRSAVLCRQYLVFVNAQAILGKQK